MLTFCPRCCRPLATPHQVKWGISDPFHERCHNRSRPWDAFCWSAIEAQLIWRDRIAASWGVIEDY